MRIIAASLLMLALAACATPYQTAGWTGGVTAEPIGADQFLVQADLNGFSDQQMVSDYMLLKAAETAQAAGARGFTIDDSRQKTTSTTGTTGGYSHVVDGRSVYVPMTQYTVQSPSGAMRITLVRDADPPEKFWVAADVIAEIGPRVRRP